MGFKCAVQSCKSSQQGRMLHSFPKDLEMFKIWVRNVGRKDICYDKRRSYRICDLHFTNEMKFAAHRNRTNLCANAIPVLHLPVPVIDEISPMATTNATNVTERILNPSRTPAISLTNNVNIREHGFVEQFNVSGVEILVKSMQRKKIGKVSCQYLLVILELLLK